VNGGSNGDTNGHTVESSEDKENTGPVTGAAGDAGSADSQVCTGVMDGSTTVKP